MKKWLGLGFIAGVLTSVAVFAQAAPEVKPSVVDIILKAFDLVHSWNVVGMWAGIVAALKLLVDALKAFGVWDKIPGALQSYTVLGVSAITVGLGVLAEKGTIQVALVATFTSAAGAMLLHELVDDALGWLKEQKEKKLSPPPTQNNP